jgi:chloride channel protein, CIC family
MSADPRPKDTVALFAGAIGVGLAAGLLAVAFESALGLAGHARTIAVRGSADSGRGLVVSIAFSALAAGVGVWLVRRFAPETAGSGIPQVEAALHRGGDLAWKRTLLVKYFGGLLAIGGGLTLGREGPTVQLGAAAGRALGGAPGPGSRRSRTFIAAGAGAGLAAAFNAPIAGTVFILEELKVLRSARHALAALMAAATADAVCRLLLSGRPSFGVVAVERPPLWTLAFFLLVGAAAGGLAAVFNRSLLGSLALFDRFRAGHGIARGVSLAVAVGAVVGLAGAYAPELLGSGEPLIERALHAPPAAAAAAVILMARFALTLVSYSSGAAGGLFAPLLVLGCQAGLLLSLGATRLAPGLGLDPAAVAIVAMGALFAGSVRAPLTGVLLMVEMTGAFTLILPLLFASATAHLAARALGARPIYEALLEREAGRAALAPLRASA